MKKALSFVLVLAILNCLLSCSTPQHVIVEKLETHSDEEYLILHRNKEVYKIIDYSIGANYIGGKLNVFIYEKGTHIHIYTKVNIFDVAHNDANNILTLPMDEINRIMYKETLAGTNFLTLPVYLAFGIIGGVALSLLILWAGPEIQFSLY